jgi:hemoglobin
LSDSLSVFDEVGGEDFFRDLVEHFYQGVSQDPILRPMYPEGDLTEAKEKLMLFLIQYWGGPATYSQTRGHPRLRMRHMPFAIDESARDAWLKHMKSALSLAVSNSGASEKTQKQMQSYFEMAAHGMVNSPSQ